METLSTLFTHIYVSGSGWVWVPSLVRPPYGLQAISEITNGTQPQPEPGTYGTWKTRSRWHSGAAENPKRASNTYPTIFYHRTVTVVQ